MHSKLPKKLEDKIETLCEQGCTQVSQLINDAKNNHHIEELAEFTGTEVDEIIDELSKIMSIYES